MTSVKTADLAKVTTVVQSVWQLSGFEKPTFGIVPLNELIGAYPIWFAEIPYLTPRQAKIFLAKKMGQTPVIDLNSDENLSGFLFAQQNRSVFTGCIFVDANDILARRRFSAAHELGHYLLHFLPAMQELAKAGKEEGMATEGLIYETSNDAEGSETNNEWAGKQIVIPGLEIAENVMLFTESWQEAEANQFAAELLMPAETCQILIAQHQVPFGRKKEFLANRLSSELLISREAITWRLASLGIGG
jgi:Zn-dependent peptidase ImmA (M78 family)